MVHRAAERLEVGAPPTDATLTNQNIPKPRIEPNGNEAPELIMASQENISPLSGVDSLQAASFASSDVSSSGMDLPTRTIPPSTSLNSQPGATIPPGAMPVSADSQTTSKPRKCGCKCSTDCNCVCLPHTCSQGCDANCQVKCNKKCGSASFRNLVVCLEVVPCHVMMMMMGPLTNLDVGFVALCGSLSPVIANEFFSFNRTQMLWSYTVGY
ncbi:hypothetical protein EDD85DRAFT_60796 [Armillaria nabsnona]|nr:hypothetical protein EDD85DRAFT_60796 [Armillaria nabsnona]